MRYKLKKMLGMLIACSILISCWSVYVGHATADAGQVAYTFNYAYDCQRSPAYPSKGGTLHASGFTTRLIQVDHMLNRFMEIGNLYI